jgi:predicted transcriptional regulator of viral defense system
MRKDDFLEIVRSKKTVLTTNDLALLWSTTNSDFIKKKTYRYVKSGKLYPLRRGIYAKDAAYDKFELASRIYTPAYISFETVLAIHGITFQYYDQIFAASYLSRAISVDSQSYEYRKLKYNLLINTTGIDIKENYFIASPERALLDVLYLNKEYYFDNLSSVRWDKILEILPIYGGNKRMADWIKTHSTERKGETIEK